MKDKLKKKLLCYSSDSELLENFGELLSDKCKFIFCDSFSKVKKQLSNKFFDLIIVDLENEIENILNELQKYKSRKENCFIVVLYGFRFNKPEYEILIHSVADSLFYKPVTIENVLYLIEEKIKTGE